MEETKKLGYDTTCPFNPAHLIPAESMQKHLLKCRKQHKSSSMVICPFNQTHYLHTREYAKHIKTCPDRILIESFRYTEKDGSGGSSNQETAQSSMASYATETASYDGNDEENWDDMDVPAYNPQKYCLENKVIRQSCHLTPAEKRAFYEEERIRHMELSKRKQ
ncbi:gametocyte-specific factor 1 homolog [Anopheles aquasalis]|uniref:gametocyte-specific factor 1 homolog n=1 Tax=Anopheles aquasalis TaxID=42839 RepID=UPI00215B2502|nr:gametocyte-specific factor 1 homolog [Anopheles aquasalis]